MKLRKACCFCMAVVISKSNAHSAIIHVPRDAPTIQIAIQNAQPFDTIILAPGIYFEAINFLGKVIAIQGSDPDDPAIVESTIIDAGGLGTVVTFSGSEGDAHASLVGVTVTGGALGIHGNGTLASIEKCIIRGNAAIGVLDVQGAITGCQILDNLDEGVSDSHGVIAHCRISGNLQGLKNCNGTIRDSTISHSRALGGGATVGNGLDQCFGLVERCLISSNESYGLHFCDATIRHSIISGNGVDGLYACRGSHIENSAIAGNRGSGFRDCALDVLHCTVASNRRYGFELHRKGAISHTIIWGNMAGSLVSSSTPVFSGTVNPYFVQPGYWDGLSNSWIEGDYILASDSPYIDAGDPSFGSGSADATEDLYGNGRVAGLRVDIGAFEFQSDCVGPDFDHDGIADICDRDIDNDGVTNTIDSCDHTPIDVPVNLTGRPYGDLNMDCAVDLMDFARWQLTVTGPASSSLQ